MCYSMLTDRTRTYMAAGEWVHLAYKTVAVWEDGSLHPIYLKQPGYWCLAFTVKKMLHGGRHGFHVASSRFGAIRAILNLIGPIVCFDPETGKCEYAGSRASNIRRHQTGPLRYRTELFRRFAVVKCLVPDRCVDRGQLDPKLKGHARSLYMLPPGANVQTSDLAKISRWIRRWAAMRTPVYTHFIPESYNNYGSHSALDYMTPAEVARYFNVASDVE